MDEMRKFTYSRTVNFTKEDHGDETFTAVEFDSFDEAITAVEKGISNRRLELSPKVNSTPISKVEDEIPKTEGTHQQEEPK